MRCVQKKLKLCRVLTGKWQYCKCMATMLKLYPLLQHSDGVFLSVSPISQPLRWREIYNTSWAILLHPSMRSNSQSLVRDQSIEQNHVNKQIKTNTS